MNFITLNNKTDLDDYDLIVVGTGLSAAVVTYIASKEYRYKVLVLGNKDDAIGGVYGHYLEPSNAHYVISTDDIRIRNFIDGISPCIDCKASSGIIYKGNAYDFHFNPWALEYAVRDVPEIPSCGGDELIERILTSLINDDHDDDALNRELLTRIALTTDHMANYPFNFYPICGFKNLIEKMFTNDNVDIAMNLKVNKIMTFDHYGNIRLFRKKIKAPVVYTDKLGELFNNEFGEMDFFSFEPLAELPDDYSGTILECSSEIGIKKMSSLYQVSTRYCRLLPNDTGVPCYPRIGFTQMDRDLKDKYLKKTDSIKNFYRCGTLGEHYPLSIAQMVINAMNVFSQLEFPHKINLLPDYVDYRRPLEQLLTPGDCFEKNADVASELIVGDLNRPVPKVSILIPTYKRLESLKRTLICAVNQDMDNDEYEIVVVDNDPDMDNETCKYLSECHVENLLYYKNTKNLGAYGNMNRGIELCRTEWISMVHDDDTVFTNALRWAMNSIDIINDKNLGMVLPRQLQVFNDNDINFRASESGGYIEKPWRKVKDYQGRFMFKILCKMRDKAKRRYWKISKLDCFMIPFLYPAPSYGTLINRKCMIDIGGYGEGYPNDDGLAAIRMSEKYNVYLCGEAWGLYSMSTADFNKPKVAVQFVECTEQYRQHMGTKSKLCAWFAKRICGPNYLRAVQSDWDALNWRLGYCLNPKNYPRFKEYDKQPRNRKNMERCKKLERLWELLLMIRAYLFGKKITKEHIDRCNGEHY